MGHYLSEGTIVIEDRSGRDGTDTLNSIERLDFNGDAFNLGKFTNVSTLTDADMLAFCELYVAYFNRAPDSTGLLFWGSELSRGTSMNEIARHFYNSAETQSLYDGASSTSDFVTAVYSNVLGRAPDASGFAYWVNALEAGNVDQASFILAMIGGAKAATGSPVDAEYLAVKAEIGAYFAVVNGLNNGSVAQIAMQAFDGTAGSVTEVKAIIDTHAALVDTAQGSEFTISVTGLLDDALDWA